jgi:two-component system copper resistance phosphate regulon response regulator CusR
VEKPFVLVADDNEATCTLIKALLQGDFIVDVAGDGQEALERLSGRDYAAVLLDLLMPVMDGYAVLESLRAHRPDLLGRVLVVTAALSSREMRRLDGYPLCGIIAKPFEVDTFLAAVRQCAGLEGPAFPRGPLLSGGMIFLLAEMLRRVQ